MFIQTKTFSDIIAEGYQYPDYIPSELRAVITSWYQFRNVCDDEKFAEMFNRVLNRDYDRYYQLLRIDPTISDYDWLVQTYRERLLEKENTGTLHTETEGTSSKTTVYGHTVGVVGSGQDTEQIAHGHVLRTVSSDDRTNTKTLNTSKTNTISDDETDTLVTSGTNTTSSESDSSGTEKGAGYTDSSNQRTLGKDMPMSNSYSGTSGMPGSLDWQNPSTQAEVSGEVTREYNDNDTGETTAHTETTTTETPNETNARSISRDNTRTENDTGTITDVLDGEAESTATNSGTDTRTITHGTGNTTTHGGRDTLSTTNGNDVSETKSESGTDREIYTGRNEDPATLLRRASSYISNSSAWEWLKKRLDVCFMQVYNQY